MKNNKTKNILSFITIIGIFICLIGIPAFASETNDLNANMNQTDQTSEVLTNDSNITENTTDANISIENAVQFMIIKVDRAYKRFSKIVKKIGL
ncbi:hypothetical protein DID75_04570 [Candidatus Marinamargulisbacteria bacterium SCGC AG-410-N11]|nr:hypothetical protein DID75_04570 [Candidatus Marinamargulisbacteria bacterium SCGC AG-410-N11]